MARCGSILTTRLDAVSVDNLCSLLSIISRKSTYLAKVVTDKLVLSVDVLTPAQVSQKHIICSI